MKLLKNFIIFWKKLWVKYLKNALSSFLSDQTDIVKIITKN